MTQEARRRMRRSRGTAPTGPGQWRFAAALGVSLVLHAAAVPAVLWPDRETSVGDVIVVDLVGAGEPSVPPPDAAGAPAGVTGSTPETAPPSGAAPAPPGGDVPPTTAIDDRVEALLAERDALATRLDAETTARAHLGDRVAALTAQTRALAEALANARRQTARLEQAAAERRAADQATHDRLLAALRHEIAEKDVELRRAREGLALSIVDRVLFPSGQARLTAEGLAVIDKVAAVLARIPSRRILIEGHTDSVPIGPELRAQFPSNRELSAARATEVVRQLAARGVSVLALEAVGRADTRPVASNDTEAGRRRNRRIEIILSGSAGASLDPSSGPAGASLDSPGPRTSGDRADTLPGGGRRQEAGRALR
jgi:chemotaxis protein MotB